MIQLSYVSSATRPMTAAELLTILQQCYGHNPLHDVTGLLLYGKGTFLQALEGDEAIVASLYEKIKRDTRHTEVTCLSRKTIARRSFPGWSMGFRRLSDAVAGISGPRANEARSEQLLAHFAPSTGLALPNEPPATEAERQLADLHMALRRAEGGLEIARLVLEDIAEAHATGRFGDTQGKLCRFALGQINGS